MTYVKISETGFAVIFTCFNWKAATFALNPWFRMISLIPEQIECFGESREPFQNPAEKNKTISSSALKT